MSIHPAAIVHPSAIVHPDAVVPASTRIGPFCIVGAHVVLGEQCELVSHVVLDGHTCIGQGVRIFSFSAVGIAPQDLKYNNEPTQLEIGDHTDIRESVTLARGTAGGGGITRVGSHCLIMAYAHIGHDSQVGNHCILANAATLAGHVTVEDYATVGALSAVHQFCTVGRHAYIGGGTIITQNVLPFSLTSAKRVARAYSLNKIGLERRGFSKEQIRQLHHAYRILLAEKLNTSQALERLKTETAANPDTNVAQLIAFIEAAERGVIK